MRLKHDLPATGFVDGAWWPHSRDLLAELPDLIAVLAGRLGSVERVSFQFDEWATAPRKLRAAGRTVRLDGYWRQPPNTIGISGSRDQAMALLVVPARTDRTVRTPS